jgi:ABC-2 type transport system permease protein
MSNALVAAYVAEARAAVRVAFADRSNLVLQAVGMAVNNGFVFAMWFLFFAGFRSIGGWRIEDVALLYGLLAITVGLAGIGFGGFRDLAASILRGDPDGVLTQPKPVLGRLLARESSASAWGDLATGPVLLAVFARLSLADLPWLILALACALAVFVSTSVIFACMAFWIAGARSLARDLTDFLVGFSGYPGSIYSGTTKLMVYTVFPAGFMVLEPVALIRRPGLPLALEIVAAAAVYAGLALLMFHLGLRRYRQGGTPQLGGS